MKKFELADLKPGPTTGFYSGVVMCTVEVFRYVFNNASFYSLTASIMYLLLFIFLTPLFAWFAFRQFVAHFWKNFLNLLAGYSVMTVLTSFIAIFIHFGIDHDYKERVADYTAESMIEKAEARERKINATIVSQIDFEGERQNELNKYSLSSLLLSPLRSLPASIILSLLFSFLFRGILPHNGNDRTIGDV
jgi:hypothetical protein